MNATPGSRLLLDRRLIQQTEGVQLTLRPGVRHPANPLPLDEHRVWTVGNLHASIYWDKSTSRYRGWHGRRVEGTREDSRYQPFESPDGLEWHDVGPDAGEGGPRTLWFDARDADASRRFKSVQMAFHRPDPDGTLTPISIAEGRRRNVAGQPVLRRMVSATSPDGMAWSAPHQIVTARLDRTHRNWIPGEPDWEGGDCFPSVLWAPELGEGGKYVAFFRTNIYNGEGQRRERAVGRADSVDFEQWGPHTLALQSKVLWHSALGYERHDFYQMQVWRAAGVYLGALSVFYWEQDRNHLELAWSPDTVNWERICPGIDLVPHGALGEYDGGCRYAAMRPIEVDDEVRLYYGGSVGRHNADHTGDSALCLATFQRDRFAGYTAGPDEGTILTRPFEMPAGALTLNVDAAGGAIHGELCDETGTALPGFGRNRSLAITSDSLAAPLTWTAERGDTDPDVASLRGRTVRLRLFLTNATAYAVAGADWR